MTTSTTDVLDADDLDAAAGSITPLPAATARLLSLANDRNVSMRAIVETVRYDPGLTATLLRQANSAFAMAVHKVTDVQDAIIRLGMNNVVGAAMRTAVSSSLDGPLDLYDLNGADLYQHSVLAAVAADVARSRRPQMIPSTTSTVALLHDIGKLVIAKAVGVRALELVSTLAATDGRATHDTEVDVFGLHHGHAGAYVIRKWKLPTTFLEGIVNHHDDTERTALSAAVQFADELAHAVDGIATSTDAPWSPSPRLCDLCEHFDLAPNRIPKLLDEVDARYQEIRSTLTR